MDYEFESCNTSVLFRKTDQQKQGQCIGCQRKEIVK